MYSTNPPQKLNLKASKNISFTKTLARTNNICSFQQDVTVYLPFTQLPTSTSPPSRTAPSNNTSRHRLCDGAFHLQKVCQIPDGLEGVRMHGAQLIFPSRQGPAMELLRLAQGGGWMTAGWRPMPWRRALCRDPRLLRVNVLVVQCGPLIVQTSKPANLRI